MASAPMGTVEFRMKKIDLMGFTEAVDAAIGQWKAEVKLAHPAAA